MSRWWMYGTGVGLEIGARDLTVSIARVRPAGGVVAASKVITNFHDRPATEWGNDYAFFLREHGVKHVSAVAVLPPSDVTVRVIQLPGVDDKSLDAAVRYQVDGLHPYNDDDVAFSYARLSRAGAVLVAVARHETVARHASAFAEAGVALQGFTAWPAALHDARRIMQPTFAPALLAMREADDAIEVYGESDARPVFAAVFADTPLDRARRLALAELRLTPDTPTESIPPLADAAAAISAIPRAALALNLLPETQRRENSRLRWAPTVALLTILAGLAGGLWYQQRYENEKLLERLTAEIKRLEPRAAEAAKLDEGINQHKARVALLDKLRAQTGKDLEALQELTRLVAPPAWTQSVYLNETGVVLQGEATQSEGLLKLVDGSPLFKNAEFMTSVGRGVAGELFQIRAQREEGAAQQASPAPPAPSAPAPNAPATMGGPPR